MLMITHCSHTSNKKAKDTDPVTWSVSTSDSWWRIFKGAYEGLGLSGMIGRRLIEGVSQDEVSKYWLQLTTFKAPENLGFEC